MLKKEKESQDTESSSDCESVSESLILVLVGAAFTLIVHERVRSWIVLVLYFIT